MRKRELTVKEFIDKAYDAVGLDGSRVVYLEVMGTSIVGVEYDPSRLRLVLYTKEPLRRLKERNDQQLSQAQIEQGITDWVRNRSSTKGDSV